MYDDNKVTYFAETDSRNKRLPFGIKRKDRSRHMYVIGKTGMGKSTLLENMAVQDITNGEGFAFIDPHGKSADLLLEYIPEHRIKDVLYFAPFDMEHPVSFNVMEDVGPDKRHLVANGLMSAFKKIWVDAWSARMEYILGNILLALLEYPDSTLIGVNRMLADKDYRKKVVDNITDPSVKAFWVDEYAKYTDRFAAEAAPAIQNKIGQFISNPLVRNIIGQPKSTFDIRQLMDTGKIIIINLSKGRMGESNANLLGSMLITKIYLAAMSRAELSERELETKPHFYLYVDEFQNFANESFADILSEARKYKLGLTVAHQYIEQMSEEVRAAVFGNVGSMVSFRVGAFDSEIMEKEFAPQFTAEDMVNLGFCQIYLKLMIDGISSPPFSATTLPPIKKGEISYVQQIVAASRAAFSRPRAQVEEEIKNWHMPVGSAPAGGQSGSQGSSSSQQGSGTQRTAPSGISRPVASFGGSEGTSKAVRSGSSASNSHTPFAEALQQPRATSSAPSPRSDDRTRTEARTDDRPKPVERRMPASQPNQTFSQAGSNPIRQRDHSSREVRENRETELRKAMSLDYLKPKPEPRAEAKKEASPENVAELRNALLAVLKDTPAAATIPATPAKETVTTEKAPVAQASAATMTTTTVKNEVTRETISIPTEAVREPAAKTETKNEGPREVPEEVLRKLLHVDPENPDSV